MISHLESRFGSELERSRELACRLEWSMLLGAVGDGLGMPFEIMTRGQIMSATGGKGVENFVDPAGVRREKNNLIWKIGQWTDDTQLSLVVAESLVACGNWNPLHCMEGHVKAAQESVAGWGSTTKQAVRNFEKAKQDSSPARPLRLDVSRPPEALPNQGGGNGPLMKVAPLALFTALRHQKNIPEVLARRVSELSFLTHSDPQAALAAYAGALLMARGIDCPVHTREEGVEALHSIVQHVQNLESAFQAKGFVSDWSNTLSGELSEIPDVVNDYDALISLSKNDNEKTQFLGRTSAILTLGLFIRNAGNAPQGMREAINAGGDTDTNASILGNMYGAHGLYKNLPPEWLKFMEQNPLLYEHIQNISKKLFAVAKARI